MKFLIYANAPTALTGYGIQCAQLATRLKRAGHDVAVACTFGHQVGVKDWPTPHGPVRLYPSGMLENSVDIIGTHALHFFEGDYQGGHIIVLNDVWALNTGLVEWEKFSVLAWAPVDHWPVPDGVLRFFHRTGAKPVAMSRFGERMFIEAGLDPLYAPLAHDGIRPLREIVIGGETKDARDVFGIPQDAFAVLMVAMNKDPGDRKNFDAAFRAFGQFWKAHKDAVLVVHTDPSGMYGSGINLHELAKHSAIPPHALIFTDAYAQRIGFTNDMLSGLYTAADVLIAPSKGEGFGVPMVEAMACGTPVIASDFTAQSELVGPGWLVSGQLEWDAPQAASYINVFHNDLLAKLLDAYDADLVAKSGECIEFAAGYHADHVYDTYWQPILDSLEPHVPKADKPLMESVQVIVPLMRPENVERLVRSFAATAPEGASILWFITDNGFTSPTIKNDPGRWDSSTTGKDFTTYAEKVNAAVWHWQYPDWVLVVGDDVEFTPGWFEAARELSDRYDVIGTNDTDGPVKNPAVANGSHADHFFVRRSYIDNEGASLEGPGILAPEVYSHWWTDKEIIELAKARGVFTPCLDSVIVHHHPGYAGDEQAREADPVYMKAVASAEADRKTFMSRAPLIAALRVSR